MKDFSQVEALNCELDILLIQEKLSTEGVSFGSPELARFYELECKYLKEKAVDHEKLIEILCLRLSKDKKEDFGLAFELFILSKDILQSRRDHILRSMWRRVILQNDWSKLSSKDDLKQSCLSLVIDYIKKTDWIPNQVILTPTNIKFYKEQQTCSEFEQILCESENVLITKYLELNLKEIFEKICGFLL